MTNSIEKVMGAIRKACQQTDGNLFASDIRINSKSEKYFTISKAGECTPIAYESAEVAAAFMGHICRIEVPMPSLRRHAPLLPDDGAVHLRLDAFHRRLHGAGRRSARAHTVDRAWHIGVFLRRVGSKRLHRQFLHRRQPVHVCGRPATLRGV